jgi:hypothetical protein
VRLAGVVALNNSLSFTSENFSKANERDVIMRTVCESTQCTDVKVREKAFECIARISDLYYDMLQPYVDTLFQLTTTAIRTDDPLGAYCDDSDTVEVLVMSPNCDSIVSLIRSPSSRCHLTVSSLTTLYSPHSRHASH